MRLGIAADHAGFTLKQELAKDLRAAGHDVVDYGAHHLDPEDDYPDLVAPLERRDVIGCRVARARVATLLRANEPPVVQTQPCPPAGQLLPS